MNLLNKPPDISKDFHAFENTFYLAEELAEFDPVSGHGKITYERHAYSSLLSFNSMDLQLEETNPKEFPPDEYEVSPALPFRVEFISSRSVRLRFVTGTEAPGQEGGSSAMLVHDGKQARNAWKHKETDEAHRFSSKHGSLIIYKRPWRIEFADAQGKVLTNSCHKTDNAATFTPLMPFGWVRRISDYARHFSAAFNLHPGEKIYGYGEFYTELNRRGQKLHLFTDDARGSQNEKSHKPVPFFLSNRGYGMFVHTPAPMTCDVGKYYGGLHSLFVGEDVLDIFVSLGEPRQILDEYTNLTGKASMPPLWSFGYWMSRITYYSEQEGREVARKLREHKLPADVIHFDSGWFETDIRCDYEFSPSRFDDPEKMIHDLKEMGFRVSLWQLPYFVPRNKLYREILEKRLYIHDGKGNSPYEDLILDFTNPETVEWYREKLAALLRMGVSAIKADFGEAAPVQGIYHNGSNGHYEHNLYPNRYNKAVADITREVTGENIIWARSGWAGSQRYPVHWGGDACTSDTGMAGVVRGGLSIGLSGFSFWSHDVGGFVAQTPENLYHRWMALGVFTSHTRSHGHPPKEPWGYSETLVKQFRNALNMRYRMMPYIYAQAKDSSEKGLPMMRALFVDYPQDRGAWDIDDQYLFGSDILVAPMLEDNPSRDVYLPGKHKWINYQSGEAYSTGWNHIKAGEVPAVILVRDGAAIPHISLAQSTAEMDWSSLELMVFSEDTKKADARIYLPGDHTLQKLHIAIANGTCTLQENPYEERVSLSLSRKISDHT